MNDMDIFVVAFKILLYIIFGVTFGYVAGKLMFRK